MATWKDVCEIAATLPDTAESIRWQGNPVIRAAGKAIVSGGDDGSCSAMTLDRKGLLATSPEIYRDNPHHHGTKWISVRLPAISKDELRELMTDAWRARVPKKLLKAHPEI